MRLRCVTIVVSVAALQWAALVASTPAVPELALARAWSVAGPGRFDASGLAVRDGKFYVVSDRHHDTIFQLEFAGDVARAVPQVKFSGPEPYPERGYLDLEGIAFAPDGGFYLASEWGFALVHVPAGGGAATWATPDLRPVGQTVGLFATTDAFIEGVAVLGDGWFLVAAERQPRGLIEVMGGNPPIRVAAQDMDATNHPPVAGRSLDFADLCVWRDRVFALARNQHLVVELVRDAEGAWREGDAWSFAATENAPAHVFTDRQYGQAEGLAIDDEHIHVLIDNNALGRASNPADTRTWLFAFRNPLR